MKSQSALLKEATDRLRDADLNNPELQDTLVELFPDLRNPSNKQLKEACERKGLAPTSEKTEKSDRVEIYHSVAEKFPLETQTITYDSKEWEELVLRHKAKFAGFDPKGKGDVMSPLQLARGQALGMLSAKQAGPRTSLFSGKTEEEIIDIVKTMITDQDMFDVEMKFATKVGGYYMRPYPQWCDKVAQLFEPNKITADFKDVLRSTKAVFAKIKTAMAEQSLETLPVLQLEDALRRVPSDTHSGYPFFTSQWAEYPKMIDYYMNEAASLLSGDEDLSDAPHILWKRVQPNGEVSKIRPVECPPKSESIAARALSDSLIDVLKGIKQFSGFNGGDNVHRFIAEMMEKEHHYSLDFSAFDAHCQELIPVIFEHLAELYPSEYASYFRNMSSYYLNSSLITPTGLVRVRPGCRHGLFSGNGWTSVIGTLANAICVEYALSNMANGDMDQSPEIFSFGDDIAIGLDNYVSAETWSRLMGEVGMECNLSKQEISSGDNSRFSFLGYYYHKTRWELVKLGELATDAMPVFPIFRILTGLIYHERYLKVTEVINRIRTVDDSPERQAQLEQYVRDCRTKERFTIEALGHVMKLNNIRNHYDALKFVEFVSKESDGAITSENILPFEELAVALRSNRTSRNFGLRKSGILQILWNQELQGDYEWPCTTNATNAEGEKIEFQSVFSVLVC